MLQVSMADTIYLFFYEKSFLQQILTDVLLTLLPVASCRPPYPIEPVLYPIPATEILSGNLENLSRQAGDNARERLDLGGNAAY